MKPGLYLQLCCMGLLLLAQQGALTHAIWHAAHGDGLPGSHETALHDDRHDGGPAGDGELLCALDAAYVSVLGAVHGHGYPLPIAAEAAEGPAWPLLLRLHAESVPAVSRGPPAIS